MKNHLQELKTAFEAFRAKFQSRKSTLKRVKVSLIEGCVRTLEIVIKDLEGSIEE